MCFRFLSVCFLSVFSVCVFSLCFLSVCFLSVFSLCVFCRCDFSLCFLSVFSVCVFSLFSLCVFCLCFFVCVFCLRVFSVCFLYVFSLCVFCRCFLSACFLCVFCLCFCLCFLSVFSLCVFCLCFLSVFSLCVFWLCFLSMFSLCILSVFSLCVFCLCFLSVFSVCFLSVFSLCVFWLCFLSMFSLCILSVFSLCFLSVFFVCVFCVFPVCSLCVFSLCFLSGPSSRLDDVNRWPLIPDRREMLLIADHQPLTMVSWYHEWWALWRWCVTTLFCSDKPWQGLEDLLLFVFMGLWWEDVDFEATLSHGNIRPTLFNMYYFVEMEQLHGALSAERVERVAKKRPADDLVLDTPLKMRAKPIPWYPSFLPASDERCHRPIVVDESVQGVSASWQKVRFLAVEWTAKSADTQRRRPIAVDESVQGVSTVWQRVRFFVVERIVYKRVWTLVCYAEVLWFALMFFELKTFFFAVGKPWKLFPLRCYLMTKWLWRWWGLQRVTVLVMSRKKVVCFLFVDRTSCICLTTLICMECSKMLTWKWRLCV